MTCPTLKLRSFPCTAILPNHGDDAVLTLENKTVSISSESHTVPDPINASPNKAYGKTPPPPRSDSMPQGNRPTAEDEDHISRVPNALRPEQLQINRTSSPDAVNTALPNSTEVVPKTSRDATMPTPESKTVSLQSISGDAAMPTEESKTTSLQSIGSEPHTIPMGTGPVIVPMTPCGAYGKTLPISTSMPQGNGPTAENEDHISRVPYVRQNQLELSSPNDDNTNSPGISGDATEESKTTSLQPIGSEPHTIPMGTGPVIVPLTPCGAYGKTLPRSTSMPQGNGPTAENEDHISRVPNVRPNQLEINRTLSPDADNTSNSPAGTSQLSDTEIDQPISLQSFESGRISSDGADSGKPASDSEGTTTPGSGTDMILENQAPVEVSTQDTTKYFTTNIVAQDPENATVFKETPV